MSCGSPRPCCPTSHGDFTAFGYRITVDGSEHVALVYGDPKSLADGEPVLTRVHSECLTGDVFGSERCDCGPQLNEAMDLIVKEGRGVVIYLRGHEGRGIGLLAKLQAYQLQDGGRDTVDANLDLGLPADARHYGAATQILRDLGVGSVRLLTNNPDKTASLESYGVPVNERVALTPRPNDHNLAVPVDQARPDGPPARRARPRPPLVEERGTSVSPPHPHSPTATRPRPRRSLTMSGAGSPRTSRSTAATCGSPSSPRAGTSR